MTDETYTQIDRENAHEFAAKLFQFANKSEFFMKTHSIATALTSVAIHYMLLAVGKERAIDWLAGIIDEIENPEDYEQEQKESGKVIDIKDFTVN